MTRYVIDAPTLVAVVRDEVAIDRSHQIVAPNRVRSDALDLLYAEVRRGELTQPEARRLHERMTELKMRLLGDRVSRWTAWAIATEHGWPSLLAAEYLAVTRLQADALVTIDPELGAAADGVVPTAPLTALSAP
jgi:predicted nucleic acid-binding protein